MDHYFIAAVAITLLAGAGAYLLAGRKRGAAVTGVLARIALLGAVALFELL